MLNILKIIVYAVTKSPPQTIFFELQFTANRYFFPTIDKQVLSIIIWEGSREKYYTLLILMF